MLFNRITLHHITHNMSNFFELCPHEILNIIFSQIIIPDDIHNNSLVSRNFNGYCYKFIRIIEKTKYITQIPPSIASKFVNLEECYLLIDSPDNELMKSLVAMKRIDISTTPYMINTYWLPYWLTQSQEKYNSICHTIYTYDNTSGGRSMVINKGIISSQYKSNYFNELVKALSTQHTINIYMNEDPSQLAFKLQPINFGIVMDVTSVQNGVLDHLIHNNNIKSISVSSNYWWCVYVTTNYRYFNIIWTAISPCDNDVDINLPIPMSELQRVYSYFPKMKSICIISHKSDPLPTIPGVKITGYDMGLDLCFN